MRYLRKSYAKHVNNMTDDAQSTAAAKPKKPFYKKWWVWTIAAVAVIALISGIGGGSSDESPVAAEQPAETEAAQVDTAVEPEPEPAPEPEPEPEPEVPAEFRSALTKAESYSDTMHMSKAGIYDQLTSEYGENFSAEAAQYAIDTIDADWKANAVAKANDYQETMAMSPEAVREQLVSEYGEKFTQEEADYAVANMDK